MKVELEFESMKSDTHDAENMRESKPVISPEQDVKLKTESDTEVKPKIEIVFKQKSEPTEESESGAEEFKPVKCDRCPQNNETFLDEESWNKHLRKHKKGHIPQKQFNRKCKICFKTIITGPARFKEHMASHIGAETFSCNICSKEFPAKHHLTSHITRKHKTNVKKSYPCKLCSKSYTQPCNLQRHIFDVHVVDKEFKCKICTRSYLDSESLKRHIEYLHDESRRNQCDVCSKRYVEKRALRNHLNNFHQRPFMCNKCLTSFVKQIELDDHIGLIISDSESLDEHERTIQCNDCKQIFRSQCNLIVHKRAHLKNTESKEKEAQSTSEENYGAEGSKHKSSKSAAELKSLTCDLCSLVCEQASHLIAHIKRAHRNELWTCKICSKSFVQRSLLKSHEGKVHGDEVFQSKKRKCDHCTEDFARFDDLNNHLISIHKMKPSFNCTVCPKVFFQESKLLLHTKSFHTGSTEFQCRTCFRFYKNPQKLKQHERRVHLLRSLNPIEKKNNKEIIKEDISKTSKTKKRKAKQKKKSSCKVCRFYADPKIVAIHMNEKHGLPIISLRRLKEGKSNQMQKN